MSATITFPFLPGVGSWSGVSSTLRFIKDTGGNNVRIELTPQCALADAEFETTQSWSSGTSFGSWTILNNGNLTTLNENTTRKSNLYLVGVTGTDWAGATQTGPFIYQTVSGDFDVMIRGAAGAPNESAGSNFSGFGVLIQDPTNTTSYLRVSATMANLGIGAVANYTIFFHDCNAGSDNFQFASAAADQFWIGGPIFLRLKKVGTTFSGYWSSDGKTWTQIGTNVTDSNMSSGTTRLGTLSANPGASGTTLVDWIRNTLPYSTAQPSASIVVDSGVNGTTWTMSTFQDLLYAATDEGWKTYSAAGFGTLAYQYGADDTNPPSLNGSWLSTASMQGQSNPTGRYFKLAVQFTSASGYDLASFSGASISGVVTTGGGGGSGGANLLGSGTLIA